MNRFRSKQSYLFCPYLLTIYYYYLVPFSASYDASVKLWNVDQGTCLHTLARHLHPVNSISFNPDGKYLTSATSDGILNVWSSQVGNSVNI